MSCPMGINTGDLTHIIRQKELPQGSMGYKAGNFAANHFAGIKVHCALYWDLPTSVIPYWEPKQ